MIGVLFVRISTFAGRCLTRGAAPDGAPPLRLYIAAGRTRHTLAQLYRPRIDPAQNRVQLADQIEWASKTAYRRIERVRASDVQGGILESRLQR
jgi:hypothetical protein